MRDYYDYSPDDFENDLDYEDFMNHEMSFIYGNDVEIFETEADAKKFLEPGMFVYHSVPYSAQSEKYEGVITLDVWVLDSKPDME